MTSVPGTDFGAESLIQRISAGEVSREFVVHAARGFLPLPQEELVAVLSYLSASDDGEIAELSRSSLSELPARVLLAFARDESARPEQIDALADASGDPAVLEAILRNRATTDATMSRLASKLPQHLQDVVVTNQERILRSPEILESLLSNPKISADARRRALEIREEFFEKKKKPEEQAPPPPLDLELELQGLSIDDSMDDEPIADLLAAATDEPAGEDGFNMEGIPEEVKKDSVFLKILKMTVAQKVYCAFKGGTTERGILIRDRNRLVCAAVMRSPKLTESEVGNIAGMRNVDDEVLRILARNREFMAKYHIVLTLVKNPKAPAGIVLPLINRLTLKDLKNLSGDKGVAEGVRTFARKLYQIRNQKNS